MACDSVQSYFFDDVASDVAHEYVASNFPLTWNVTLQSHVSVDETLPRGMSLQSFIWLTWNVTGGSHIRCRNVGDEEF